MDIIKFQERLIAFDFNNEMVNANDMLKAFPKKRMNNFLRQKQTKEFITQLESDALNSATKDFQAVRVVKGGNKQGTWMCKLLSFKFAAYLSSEFELFVYKSFDQYMQIKLAEHKDKLMDQQRQLDYFWDKSDQQDLYNR